MWNWKTFVIVFKFVSSLKKKKLLSHHNLQNLNQINVHNGKNNNSARRIDLRHPKIAPLRIGSVTENGGFQDTPSPFVTQSITRQLAFGFKDAKDVEAATTPTKTIRADFYNGGWGNIVAKIITVTVLAVVLLFLIVILTRK